MINPKKLRQSLDRIADGEGTKDDIELLRQLLRAGDSQNFIQLGKYNINITEGKDIQIGDRIYQGTDAEVIKEALRLVLQEKQKAERPRNEKLLLQVVKDEVFARLKQSLHNTVLINLGKEAQPEQVKSPWNSDIKVGHNKRETIPDNRSILEVFDQEEVAGKLLILGNPGAGKTTTMLELAKALVVRAEQDADYPIPVLFNLSTWKDEKQSIRDWLIAELKSKYGVRKDIGYKWVWDAKLLPMLDGLDELESVRQERCVQKINELLQSDFRPQYLVVCSRQEEYEKVVRRQWQQDVQEEAEEIRLHLNASILLQHLTDEQIQSYLIGLNQIELWEKLQLDAELLKLVRTPLFLSVIGFISFHNTLSLQEWKTLTSSEARLEYLLDAYWKAAIKRPTLAPKKKKYPNIFQTRKWLVFLAQQLQHESQTEFLIERIEPILLPNNFARQKYAIGIGLFFGLIGGTVVGIITFINVLKFINTTYSVITGLVIGIFFGVFFCLWAFLTIGQSPDIKPVETLNKSWINLGKSLSLGLLIGVLSWLVVEIICRWLGWKPFAIEFFLIIGPALVSIIEMSGPQLQITTKPNEGIWRSLNNAIRFAFTAGLWLGLSAFVMRQKIFSLIVSLVLNQSGITSSFVLSVVDTVIIMFSGMLAGLFFGITQAGTACIQHFILRIILYCEGYIPWNYARFLDYCTDRLFFQRVGGRYRFIHRLLQEHFAAMFVEK
jgi:Effector-associated domain 10/NACHT domain